MFGWTKSLAPKSNQTSDAALYEAAIYEALVKSSIHSPAIGYGAGPLGPYGHPRTITVAYSRGGALRPLGLADGQLEGHPLAQYANRDFSEAVEKARTEGPVTYLTDFKDQSGRWRKYQATVSVLSHDEVSSHLGLSADEVFISWHFCDLTEMWESVQRSEQDKDRTISQLRGSLSKLRERDDERLRTLIESSKKSSEREHS